MGERLLLGGLSVLTLLAFMYVFLTPLPEPILRVPSVHAATVANDSQFPDLNYCPSAQDWYVAGASKPLAYRVSWVPVVQPFPPNAYQADLGERRGYNLKFRIDVDAAGNRTVVPLHE